MKIKRLDWDSSFFGYEIGRLDTDEEFLDIALFTELAIPFKLVYVFSKEKLIKKELQEVDQKIILHQLIEKNLYSEVNDSFIQSFKEGVDNYKELQELALASGKYSRFNVDKNFQNKEFQKLYLKWIEKSVVHGGSIDVKVYKENDEILGFISLDEHDNQTVEIGLVAVGEKARGKGVATSLMKACLLHARKLGFKKIEVTTQLQNKPAMKLYKKCNFEVKQITHIYHYWNK